MDAIQEIERYVTRKDVGFFSKGADSVPNGPYMLRGIAGSGKTVQLCQRAAIAHKYRPDWNIAVVFFTRSLYGYVEGLVRHYCDLLGVRWDPSKLCVLHAWGGWNRDGFYKDQARRHGVHSLSKNDVSLDYAEGLAYACKQLLEQTEITPHYDMILIDEGQDLVVDDDTLLFHGRQPIYWLAYQSLKLVYPSKPEIRRLIWAFDEYQSISNIKVPTSVELFGADPEHRKLMKGRSSVMRICYRTPLSILMAAHSLGMGLYNPDGMICGPTNADDWRALGYDVYGSFRIGNTINLTRKAENSPNPVYSSWKGSLLVFKPGFHDRREEAQAVAEDIYHHVVDKGVRPDDILVVTMENAVVALQDIWSELKTRGIPAYIASATDACSIDVGSQRDRFRQPGCVSISRVTRAKGNEANLVYVVNLDAIVKRVNELSARNALFTAMTRSRGWLWLSGCGDHDFFREVRKTIGDVNSKKVLAFEYKRPPVHKRDTIQSEAPGWQMTLDTW